MTQHLHLLVWGLSFVGLDSPHNKLSRKSKFTKNRVQSKKLWFFLYGDLCCSEDPRRFHPFMWRLHACAWRFWGLQVITASFWPPTASFCGVSIYIPIPHLLAELLAPISLPTHSKPFVSSPNLSLCESEVLSEWLSVGSKRLRVWEQTKPWALVGPRQSFVAHLLLLEVRPPRRQDVARLAPVLIVSCGKVCITRWS
jgi:hypothetical protein